jgi:hypothetical protein
MAWFYSVRLFSSETHALLGSSQNLANDEFSMIILIVVSELSNKYWDKYELSTFLLNSVLVDVGYFQLFAKAMPWMSPAVAAWHPANAGNASARLSSSPWSPALLRGFLRRGQHGGSMGGSP